MFINKTKYNNYKHHYFQKNGKSTYKLIFKQACKMVGRFYFLATTNYMYSVD